VESRSDTKRPQNAPTAQTRQRKGKLRIVKLEERIAPKLSANHNQTLVREPAKPKHQSREVRKDARKPRLQLVKLEERLSPRLSANHNQTLVREPGESKLKAPEIGKAPRRLKLRIVKLEERITPTPSIPIPPP